MKRVSTHIQDHLHDYVKDNGLVFKDILEEGIEKKMSIEYEEKELIKELEVHNKESDRIMNRLQDIERIKEDIKDEVAIITLEKVLRFIEKSYLRNGKVEHDSLEYWAVELDMSFEELLQKAKKEFKYIEVSYTKVENDKNYGFAQY